MLIPRATTQAEDAKAVRQILTKVRLTRIISWEEIADVLNRRVLNGKITGLVVIAAPKALGELRKHYHKELEAILVGEIAKDLTGHSIQDIEKSIAAA